MKFRHTPGPWSTFISDSGGQWSGWPLSIGPDDDEEKSVVRSGGFYPYEWDATISQAEAVANAHLMAASPELLNALIAALPVLTQAAQAGDAAAAAAEAVARQALAKAVRT